MADVFVSYDRRDRELAQKVVGALTEQGLTVWWDDRITPHETWDKTIEREVDSARRVLVLWTENSVQSDWVRTEAGAAKESTPPKLIQARFSDCKVPLAFRLLQHVDLIGWTPKRRHTGWERLIHWLKDGKEAEAAEAAPAPADTRPQGLISTPAEPVASVAESTTGSGGGIELPKIDIPKIELPKIDLPEMPKIEVPKIDLPNFGGGGGGGDDAGSGQATGGSRGIDRRLLIGGAFAGAALIAVVLAVMALMNGGGGGSQIGEGGGANGVSADVRRTIGGYLDEYQRRYAEGARPVGEDVTASLDDGGSHEFVIDLQEGHRYRVLGACDTRCSDVDLIVEDAAGQQVDQDVLLDDYPVVDINPTADARYRVRIGMPGCGTNPCVGAARLVQVG